MALRMSTVALLLALALTACEGPPTRGSVSAPTGAPNPGVAAQPANGSPQGVPGMSTTTGTTTRPTTPTPTGTASADVTPTGSPSPTATPTPDSRLPVEAAYITGEIISSAPATGGDLYLAQITVVDDAGTNQAAITVLSSTAIWRQGQTGNLVRLSAAELGVGQAVKVWTAGPVRESFPVQFDAKTLVVLPEAAATPEPALR